MNHKERISALLAGEPVDRLPVSVWSHDFLREWSAEDLAAQTIEKYRTYDYDFMKINPRWTMYGEPWGNRYEMPTEQRFPRVLQLTVNGADDFSRVPVVDAGHPVFREHETAVAAIVDAIGDEVDCIATVFSPLAALGLLAGGVGKPLLQYLPDAAEDMHACLAHMTDTLAGHAQALLNAGAAGIFYAPLQWTSLDTCPADVYAEFGEPYDKKFLAAVSGARFNMMHVCGNNTDLSRYFGYAVNVLNWDNFGTGNPGLAEASRLSGKVVAGGIPHRAIHKIDEATLTAEAHAATRDVPGPLMLAGGCAIGALVSDGPRQAVVRVAEQIS